MVITIAPILTPEGSDRGQQVGNRRVNFLLVEVSYPAMHQIEGPSLFADAYHLWEYNYRFQRVHEVLAALDVRVNFHHRFFGNYVSGSACGDVKRFQDRRSRKEL